MLGQQQLRMSDIGIDIEQRDNFESENEELTPLIDIVPVFEKSRPSYKGSRRKEIKEERAQVGELFKELISVVNSHMSINSAENSDQANFQEKKKLKPIKPIKQIKDVEVREQLIQNVLQNKVFKKLAPKVEAKQFQRKEKAKAKNQIFKNYCQIMTYKIHPEERKHLHHEPFLHFGRPRRNFTIQQNLMIMFDPVTKQTKINF